MEDDKLIEIQPEPVSRNENQSNIEKFLLVTSSPLLVYPICLWNDCLRECFNRYGNYKFPPIGIIEDNKVSTDNIDDCFLYPQSNTYSTTLCCIHFHIYDPCTQY